MLQDHIHPAQAEERGGGEEVFVVRENLGEAVFGGGGEVEGVGGAEISGCRGGGEHAFDADDDGIGEGQPFQVSCACLIVDLSEEGVVLSGSGGAFPNFAEGGGSKFGTSMQRANENVHGGRMRADFGGTAFATLKLEEVVRVVEGGVHRASRSSEMICVESVPPLKAPVLSIAS